MNTKEKLLQGEILILDNALPAPLFSKIKNKINDSSLWKYTNETSLGGTKGDHKSTLTQLNYHDSKYNPDTTSFQDTFSFGNIIFFVDGPNSQPKEFIPHLFDNTELALALTLENVGLNLLNLIRIRTGLITHKNDPSFHFPHVDMTFSHFNALLYLTTCNAPTRIFNETYNFDYKNEVKKSSNEIPQDVEFLHKEYGGVLSTKCEIDSFENRMVIFYGAHYHSSSCPVDTNNRIVINYNFIA